MSNRQVESRASSLPAPDPALRAGMRRDGPLHGAALRSDYDGAVADEAACSM